MVGCGHEKGQRFLKVSPRAGRWCAAEVLVVVSLNKCFFVQLQIVGGGGVFAHWLRLRSMTLRAYWGDIPGLDAGACASM